MPRLGSNARRLLTAGAVVSATLISPSLTAARATPARAEAPFATASATAWLTASRAPQAPGKPTAAMFKGDVRVKWPAARSTRSAPVQRYTATASPGGQQCAASGTSCVIRGLASGQTYTFSAISSNGFGPSASSPPSDPLTVVRVPGAPLNPTAGTTPSGVQVAWDAPADSGGQTITGYAVVSAPGRKACLTSGERSCTVHGLTPGLSYTFSVKATNATGSGPISAPTASIRFLLPPATPFAPTATAGNRSAEVRWAAVAPTAGTPTSGYTVTSSPDSQTCTTTTALKCTVTNLTPGTPYTFTVKSRSTVRLSDPSAPSAPVTPFATVLAPDAPTNVSAVGGNRSASVSWSTPASDGGAPITSYTVTSNPDGAHCTTDQLSCKVLRLGTAKTYTFTVRATNGNGDSSESDPSSQVATDDYAPRDGFPGFQVGIDDYTVDWWAPASVREAHRRWLSATDSGILRSQISWARLAPTQPSNPKDPADPAYNWNSADYLARQATAIGAEAMINLYNAPKWAEGAGMPASAYEGSWKPDPAALKSLAIAIATRYSGNWPDPLKPGAKLPRIRLYEAWNEPNLRRYLSPQYERVGGVSVLTVPARYRLMLNAIYEGIKSVQPDARVLTAGLGPYGSSSLGREVAPQPFLKVLLCLKAASSVSAKSTACAVKPELDGVSIHPYSFGFKPTTKANSDSTALGNVPDVRKIVDQATSRHLLNPDSPKLLYVTEWAWITDPPGRVTSNSSQSKGIDPELAARYTAETIYRLWSWGVSGAVWFGVRDVHQLWPGGLFFKGAADDLATAKPGLAAFQFPIFARSTVGRTALWALSPCTGPGASVNFQQKVGVAWQDVADGSPDGSRVVSASGPQLAPGTIVRAVASDSAGCGETSLEMPVSSS